MLTSCQVVVGSELLGVQQMFPAHTGGTATAAFSTPGLAVISTAAIGATGGICATGGIWETAPAPPPWSRRASRRGEGLRRGASRRDRTRELCRAGA